MPKSKRNKLITLSKTTKKGRERKKGLIDSVRECFEEFRELYVFEFRNMRNPFFKTLREDLKSSSRLFLGSNKVLQVALGRDPASEIKENVHKVCECLTGQRGLLFTNLPKEEVLKKLGEFECSDYARTGSLATETIELKEGPLDQFSHDMEPFLRKQSLPVRLNKGVIELVADHIVCEKGKPISPEASRTLRLLGIQMSVFQLHPVCRWTPQEFEMFDVPESAEEDEEDDDGGDVEDASDNAD